MRRALAVLILLTGCADMNIPRLLPEPPELMRPPPPDPEIYTPAPGSLWRGDASRRFLAFENRAKRIGDLVTVTIDESATALSEASTDLERKSTYDASIDSDLGLHRLITRPIREVFNLLGMGFERVDDQNTAVSVVEADTNTKYEGDGSVEREATFTTTVACLITELSPSGLLYLEGERWLKIGKETQVIQVSGYVRPEDIRLDNTIPSALIASADIQYGGRGAIAAQQRDPWMMRIFSWFLPF